MNGNAFATGPALSVRNLGIRGGERTLVERLDLDIAPGTFVAILGRNGCGKSLTLHALAGLNAPAAGHIELCGTDLRTLSRRQIARQLGLLPQDREEALPLNALESVLIGRHPHLPFWQRESATDQRIAHEALAQLGVAHCAQRLLATLSGGEQRRVAMAALLAQQPRVHLLDEPTNHLDPHHQIAILDLFRTLCTQGAAVIATLHDPTLAARFADIALLLHGDGRWQAGPVDEVLRVPQLSALYLTELTEVEAHGRRAFVVG